MMTIFFYNCSLVSIIKLFKLLPSPSYENKNFRMKEISTQSLSKKKDFLFVLSSIKENQGFLLSLSEIEGSYDV